MRWSGQEIRASSDALPGLEALDDLVATVRTPEFAGLTFHEVRAKSALNQVPGASKVMPYGWTINPYRGCSHACVYCFARPTHEYLDFDGGHDFDTQIVVKVNVVDVLRAELKRTSWMRAPVALGTNTDPYQRAEGRYRLMPGIVTALAESGTPVSILTKGTMLRRDLPLLKEASAQVPVGISMSIAVYDDELQEHIEPGAPSATARLATVKAAREAGLDVTVFLMPVLPYLTDSTSHLDLALERIAEAGASSVLWTPLHLKPGVREWYLAWLHEHHPEHEDAYRSMYRGRSYAPKEYREWLGTRIRPLIAKHRLQIGVEEPMTGTLRSRALRIPDPEPKPRAAQPPPLW
jgi:DNA repair photolyase